jgi:hypothetical protein
VKYEGLSAVDTATSLDETTGETSGVAHWRPPDGRRMLQLALAAVWLLDGVLQLQPFFFTSGPNGLSAMLKGAAAGNPSFVARSITWNASIVGHHAEVTNAAFAFIQILLGFGIAWRASLKPALVISIVWSLGVWWFGEGLGGVFNGNGSPLAGSPGAVLFYALLAVLLWPPRRPDLRGPLVAAGRVGIVAAKVVWVVVWVGMGVLALIGSARSPEGVHDLIDGLKAGQPGWLAALDRHAESLVAHRGLTVALVFAALCVVVALSAFLSVRATRAGIVLAVLAAAAIWVVGQNFGLIFVGGATDPNSGPLLILLALAYWPVLPPPVTPTEVRTVPSPLAVTFGRS